MDTTTGATKDGGECTFEVTGSRPRAPFGPDPVPEGIDVVEVDSPAGPLTAFLAASGVPERGRVLMVPGYTGSKEDFTHFIPRLTARGYAVLAYSQRGQADSAAPRGRRHYHLDDFVGDLLAVASHMGAGPGHPVHLLGHSFGGVVARAAVIADPRPFATLTLFSSGPRAVTGVVSPLLLALVPHGRLGHRILMRALHPDMPDAPQADPRLETLRLRSRVSADDNLVGAGRILTTYGDTTRALAATGIPVHLVHGDADPVWPLDWYPEEARILGARHTVIPHAQHSAQWENPGALAPALVDFWDAHRPSPDRPTSH